MPIVSGNEPKQPQKKTGTLGCGWLLPLLIFGQPIISLVRRALAGRVDDQQLLIIGAGVVALLVMVVIVRRVNEARSNNTTSLPTPYQPPTTNPPPFTQSRVQPGQPLVPRPPQFEPIITGKVVLAGLVLAMLFAGAAFVFVISR